MKNLLFALCILSFAACNSSSENNASSAEDKDLMSTELVTNPNTADGTNAEILAEMATMDFKDTLHNFGNLTEGEVGSYDFEFVNNGKKPLVISSASGSCGCTVPDYPREPVAAGKTGIIKVKFDTQGKPGHQEKSVTVQTNSVRGTHMLYIKADVAGKETGN